MIGSYRQDYNRCLTVAGAPLVTTVKFIPKVMFGDQATCKTIRGAKRWSCTEIEEVRKLQWAKEVPGKMGPLQNDHASNDNYTCVYT